MQKWIYQVKCTKCGREEIDEFLWETCTTCGAPMRIIKKWPGGQ